MKRSLVAAALAAAMLLLAVPAVSGASTAGHRTGPPREGAPATAQAARAAWLRTQPRYIPAAEAIAGPAAADVTGTVFRYDGGPLADADMAWWIDADGSQGEGGTDADGKFFFGGVPVTDAGGTLRVDATDGTLSMAWWGLTWTAAGPNAFDLRPGGIEVGGGHCLPGPRASSVQCPARRSAYVLLYIHKLCLFAGTLLLMENS